MLENELTPNVKNCGYKISYAWNSTRSSNIVINVRLQMKQKRLVICAHPHVHLHNVFYTKPFLEKKADIQLLIGVQTHVTQHSYFEFNRFIAGRTGILLFTVCMNT